MMRETAQSAEMLDIAEGGFQQYGLAGWLMRRWNLRKMSRRANVKKMQLLETLHVGKSHLMLVRCGEEQFLAGGGADGITAIVKINVDGVERCAL